METKEITKHTLRDYQNITGLRSYMACDNVVTQSAPEENYSYKCLRSSSRALKKCKECTEETYENARKINHECVYSCRTNLIKWAVPVQRGNFHCITTSKGVFAMKRTGGADKWAKYLSRGYQLDKSMLPENFKAIQTMDEDQMNASIELLKDLLFYHFAIAEKQAQRFIFI